MNRAGGAEHLLCRTGSDDGVCVVYKQKLYITNVSWFLNCYHQIPLT